MPVPMSMRMSVNRTIPPTPSSLHLLQLIHLLLLLLLQLLLLLLMMSNTNRSH
jgi:hypothetical protein